MKTKISLLALAAFAICALPSARADSAGQAMVNTLQQDMKNLQAAQQALHAYQQSKASGEIGGAATGAGLGDAQDLKNAGSWQVRNQLQSEKSLKDAVKQAKSKFKTDTKTFTAMVDSHQGIRNALNDAKASCKTGTHAHNTCNPSTHTHGMCNPSAHTHSMSTSGTNTVSHTTITSTKPTAPPRTYSPYSSMH